MMGKSGKYPGAYLRRSAIFVKLQVERKQFLKLYSIVNVFVKCFKSSLIGIANYLLRVSSAMVEMSLRLTIQCNIAEVP